MDLKTIAREFAVKMIDDANSVVDLATGSDGSAAVAVRINADGSMTVIGWKEFYAGHDLDLKATDITGQKSLPKPTA